MRDLMEDGSSGYRIDRQYTIKELATALNIGVEKARQLVKDEPGVLKLTNNKRMMYRVPESVVKRIIRRCSNPPLPNW
jgi:hypothetical protein